ncbi:MAG: diguanylate cyclase [Syntrophaceae bacterium]|nr:diguanylate cyclase [Syntrophaceae bacterium]
MTATILAISGNFNTVSSLEKMLSGMGKVRIFKHFSSAFEILYNENPLLMIVDVFDDKDTIPLLNTFKDDPLFTGVPVLAIVDEEKMPVDWQSIHVDDYIRRENLERDITMRAQLAILRAERVVEVNPLTRLPGNIAINRQIQTRIDEKKPFAMSYADLDHFKPFNDKYGFSRGDEVLRITGRLILNIVKGSYSQDSFVGHIGGDDFVFITNPSVMEDACRDIIDAFDHIIPTFYDQDDRQAGFIQSLDREGHMKMFPFLSITMGVVYTDGLHFSHYGEVTEIASEMKKFAKNKAGSCYKINRRSYNPQQDLQDRQTP